MIGISLPRLAWRLLRHLDGHETAGARVEKRESHTDLRDTQRLHSQPSIVPHLPPRDCGPDHSRMFGREPPGNEPAKCHLTAFPYYHGMLLEPVDYLVLLIGTLTSTGWGFVLLGLS
jgi:hypothetical protein